jgi:serine/threonine protein phosphatase 1
MKRFYMENKNKRFVIGDIHGAHKALIQCLNKSGLNKDEDLLICLGDVADGWPEVPDCFDELLKIKNLVYIMGNHDNWLLEYFKFGVTPRIWTSQGGDATLDAYSRYIDTTAHQQLLERALYYYVIDNKLFVHGGYDWNDDIENTSRRDMMWDRDLIQAAVYWNKQAPKTGVMNRVKDYDEVFIGHTTTSRFDPELKPLHVSNVWDLDQGAGWEGKLTIMDIDSKKYWQSDIVKELYPWVQGRG